MKSSSGTSCANFQGLQKNKERMTPCVVLGLPVLSREFRCRETFTGRTFMNHTIFKKAPGPPAVSPGVYLVNGVPSNVGTQASDLLQAFPAVHLQTAAHVALRNSLQHEAVLFLNV